MSQSLVNLLMTSYHLSNQQGKISLESEERWVATLWFLLLCPQVALRTPTGPVLQQEMWQVVCALQWPLQLQGSHLPLGFFPSPRKREPVVSLLGYGGAVGID